MGDTNFISNKNSQTHKQTALVFGNGKGRVEILRMHVDNNVAFTVRSFDGLQSRILQRLMNCHFFPSPDYFSHNRRSKAGFSTGVLEWWESI